MTTEITIDISDVRHAIGHKDFTVFDRAQESKTGDRAKMSISQCFAAGCEARTQSLKDKGAETALTSTNKQVNLIAGNQSEQDSETSSELYTCRSSMCSAFQGEYVSATFRAGKKIEGFPNKGWQAAHSFNLCLA